MQLCIQDTLSSRARLAERPSARASKGILHTTCNYNVIIRVRVKVRVRVK